MPNTPVAPLGLLGGATPRYISDDDLCSSCVHCSYEPGSLSTCALVWPSQVDPSAEISECHAFAAAEER